MLDLASPNSPVLTSFAVYIAGTLASFLPFGFMSFKPPGNVGVFALPVSPLFGRLFCWLLKLATPSQPLYVSLTIKSYEAFPILYVVSIALFYLPNAMLIFICIRKTISFIYMITYLYTSSSIQI